MNFTEKSHEIAAEFGGIKTAVDATLGGGRDALFLASLDGCEKVYGFDVQPAALERSRRLFESRGVAEKVELFLTGHENMAQVLGADKRGKINCFFFNLGWLPNSDKSIATRAETTLAALAAASELADTSHCLLSILCYKAHSGAMAEFEAVRDFVRENFGAHESYTDPSNSRSPELIVVKLRG